MEIDWPNLATKLIGKGQELMTFAEQDHDNAAAMMAASLVLSGIGGAIREAMVVETCPTAKIAEIRSRLRSEVARIKGYTGDICPECGNATMSRNGTCLKCETCGGTSGCS